MEKRYKPVASWRHFALVIAIMMVIAIRGLQFVSKGQGAVTTRNHIALYISLILVEAALVYLVWRGIRATGTTLKDLIGGRWNSPRDIVRDFALGLLLWILLLAIASIWRNVGGGGGLSESVSAMLPDTLPEKIFWIGASLSAGFAEEVTFRGYCQRQFEALTNNRWIAAALQAILFGVSHGYQGVDAMIRISVLGLAFGLMSIWRRSLRPAIIAHSWTDIASGLFYPG
jgi:membrane protease YdiL (CAAX protease family)